MNTNSLPGWPADNSSPPPLSPIAAATHRWTGPQTHRWTGPATDQRPGQAAHRWTGPATSFEGRSGSAGLSRDLYAVVLLDVAGSASRSGRALRAMRDELYHLVDEVMGDLGVDLASLPFDDTGDGLRLAIPPDLIRPTRVVDLFVYGLAAGLREHRAMVRPSSRIRLRMAFDLGLIEPHRRSWVGDPLIRVARLVDGEPLRKALRADRRTDLAAAVSDEMYQTVVRPRYGQIPLACFEEIRVRVKEFDDRAWLLVPRSTCVCTRCGGRRREAAGSRRRAALEPRRRAGSPRAPGSQLYVSRVIRT